MENQSKTEGFRYTYSAKEQEELRRIREKYASREENKEENKMEQLRKLDASVTRKATVVALVMGILGTLVMGIGMSFTMTELGSYIGIRGMFAMILGIVIGVIGMTFAGCAYPVYRSVLRKERERIAPEMLRLADELMK